MPRGVTVTDNVSRSTVNLIHQIRAGIAKGLYPAGRYLPTIRELSVQHKVSTETIRRGLKLLEKNGLVLGVARHGFRVVGTGHDQESCSHQPVAYVTGHQADLSDAQPVNWAISRAIQLAAGEREWATLGVHSGRQDTSLVVEQLRSASVWGVLLDTLDPQIVEAVRSLGVPTVMINSWLEDVPTDVVLQDNYRGGYLAARHLVNVGAKHPAWIGSIRGSCHSRERYAGAVAGLALEGRVLEPTAEDLWSGESEAAIRRLLSGTHRPDGVLVFGGKLLRAVKKVADEMGIRIGRDLHLVGWSVEEMAEAEHRSVFAGGEIPPAVVWSARAMVDTALDLLQYRRGHPNQSPLRVQVPTHLAFART